MQSWPVGFSIRLQSIAGNATIEEVIHRPKPLLVAQAMHVMMQTYVLVARDPTPSLRTVHHRFSMAIPGFKTIPCNWVEA